MIDMVMMVLSVITMLTEETQDVKEDQIASQPQKMLLNIRKTVIATFRFKV